MEFCIKVFKSVMNCIYKILKLFKTKNKVTFISRQSNKIGIDFKLLVEEIKKESPETKIVVLNKELNKNIISKIIYFFHMFVQMYHIATSKVIILDGYCIMISILKHKKELKVVQIWHALGSLKKFGYSTIGKKDGRDSKIAELMEMHKNYDYVLTSSKESRPFFREAFNIQNEKMLVMSLPRVDYLQSDKYKEIITNKFYEIYCECDTKKENILYCPTHRKKENIDSVKIEELVKSIDLDKYNFVVKLHDGQEYVYTYNKNYKEQTDFTGMDLLHIADYIITDYSAIVYEASILEKPIYFYTYDYDKYMDDRGWYIDYNKEMPGPIVSDFDNIVKMIESKKFDKQKIIEFRNKYIEDLSKKSTNKLTKFILELIKVS